MNNLLAKLKIAEIMTRDTVMDNPFGPTLCQSLHYCRSCQQSFQRFKPL
jgi:ring-1,2-phenylacetyl-CoA epoxidase subunit PaaD